MLGKLTLVAILCGSISIQAEHRSLPAQEYSSRPQSESRVAVHSAIPPSESFQELQNILFGQLTYFKSQKEVGDRINDLSKQELIDLLELAEKKIPLETQDEFYRDSFYLVYAGLLARENPLNVIALVSPQAFPEEVKDSRFNPPQLYQHPSGAIQLGRVEFERPNGQGTGNRIPISPGVSSGKNVLRISLHGSGIESQYSLLNPSSDEVPVGYYADRRNIKPSDETLIALRKHLPRFFNPEEIISESCNPDLKGCTPATYARWLEVERTPSPDKLNLKKVVMTPSGFSSGGIVDTPVSRLFGDQGSFAQPYYREWVVNNFDPELSPPREYRLIRGGNAENIHHWIDTGIYTDSRQASFPLIGIWGEAKEYGRHLGLSPELGGGNSLSYLDKIRSINENPDATYFQKVRSNLTRPLGSAAALTREIYGLSGDLYRLWW